VRAKPLARKRGLRDLVHDAWRRAQRSGGSGRTPARSRVHALTRSSARSLQSSRRSQRPMRLPNAVTIRLLAPAFVGDYV